MFILYERPRFYSPGGGGGLLPYKRLMGYAAETERVFPTGLAIMGLHFHKELLEWGYTFSDFWDKIRSSYLRLANEPGCLYC